MISESGLRYLTRKRSVQTVTLEQEEAAQRQNVALYEAIADLYEEVLALQEEVKQLKGGAE